MEGEGYHLWAGTAASQEWDAAYTKAEAAVANLTLKEKVVLTTGKGYFTSTCTGNIGSIDSINFPGICLQDSALGVRNTQGNSAFPAGINAAATFNRTLMYQRGAAMGAEFRGKGINVQLGPYMNLMRLPASGRAWEGFGADPYLTGEGAYQSVLGIQSQGVQAVAKHFLNNEQERSRAFSSSNVDDRTVSAKSSLNSRRQGWLTSVQATRTVPPPRASNPPFIETASLNLHRPVVPPQHPGERGSGDIKAMNDTYACENNATLHGYLKGELGFRGYVMSDWYATHSTADAANHGLDVTMPGDVIPGGGISWFGDSLVLAVDLGSVNESVVDEMATRVLAGWYLLGQDQGFPETNIGSSGPDVQGDHASLIRTIDAAATVLLKNDKGMLPLKSPRSIAIIGDGAGSNPSGPNACADRSCDKGVLGMGWGSGTANYPYLIAPVDAITNRSKETNTTVVSSLSDSDLKAAAKAAAGASVALVFITADSGELGYIVEGTDGDRNNLNAWHNGDDLVNAVASVNNNTIVVVNTVGPILVEAWIDHPNVTGLVWSGLPGQEAGNALVDVLWGDYNPRQVYGRLPYTIAKNQSDYPAQVDFDISLSTIQISYNEGLFIDYRHFDAANIAPRYEFGFGLSYTTFDYSGLSVNGSLTSGSNYDATVVGASLDAALHETAASVTFTLTNNGTVAGHEIPQLYISMPSSSNEPPYLLKGFDSIFLSPGESTQVTLSLSRYDLSFWNAETQKWEVPQGSFGITASTYAGVFRMSSTLATVFNLTIKTLQAIPDPVSSAVIGLVTEIWNAVQQDTVLDEPKQAPSPPPVPARV
ncbi:beta-glucosidase [Gloeophyllum trabeum ATCC 11539]|uniref:beta-glucosidase n=1 Tax=Gloeophyllum trabeum (strain ATCC 11539 / FP-39264 / Madison 617) TaxID=670483 RepID=S7Q6E8_GLOTA|nr:beta-glucosidase [Gloeophyllum trabeum ATCC 11539]EPQ55082.1 beta-glucosidase [Gloeophyllum trabeum ATCC 11539]